MVYAWGLGFSAGSSSSGGAGLGLIDRRPAQNLRNKGVVRTKSAKKIHSAGNLGYLAFNKAIRLQKNLLWDNFPRRKVAEPFFKRRGQGCHIISDHPIANSKPAQLFMTLRLVRLKGHLGLCGRLFRLFMMAWVNKAQSSQPSTKPVIKPPGRPRLSLL